MKTEPAADGGNPTIHDVAQRAGVATSTVSRALAGEPRVAEATRRRVIRIAGEVGYSPSRSARSLRSSRTGTIGLLVPDLENPIGYEHLRATVHAAFEAGYTVLVGDAQSSPEIQNAELSRLREYRVDGIVLGRGILPVTQPLVDLAASRLPVEPLLPPAADLAMHLGGVITPDPDRPALDAAASTIAFRHLVALGHRKFAYFVRSIGKTQLARSRQQSLTGVLAAASIDPSNAVFVDVGQPRDCMAEVQKLVAGNDRPTAFISANGLLTPYVLEGLYSSGLRIPDDASFLCFGDSPWQRGYAPPLSVIRHDYAAAAKRSIDRLIARIEGREPPEIPHRPSEFVSRSSIGPAPALRNGRAEDTSISWGTARA